MRNQTVLNLIEDFAKREPMDRQLHCVDTCTGKRHLTGHEQMLEARWSFEKGTDESIRTHNVITLARSVAYRVSAIQGLKFRHMDSETTGSVAAGVPEIPAALLRAEDGKGNHVGRQLVTGCLPHSNPLLCSVAATGQTLVLQFHPHLWNRIPPDFSSRDKWFGMHVLTAFENRNCHNMISQTTLCNDIGRMFTEAFGWSEDRVKRDLKGICSHLGRCTNAADTSDANAPDRQADRIGGWSSSEGSRRDSSYLVHRIPLAAARALAGTPGDDMTRPHRMDHIPNATFAVPSGTHVPDLVREILPSVPMRFVGEWVPFLPEWFARLQDEDDEIWSEQGADDKRTSATNCVKGCIFDVKVYTINLLRI